MAIFGAARQLCRQNRLKTHTHTQRQSHTLSLTHTYAASSVHLPNAKTLACLSSFEPDSSLKMPPPSTTRPQEANKIDRKKQTENIRYIYIDIAGVQTSVKVSKIQAEQFKNSSPLGHRDTVVASPAASCRWPIQLPQNVCYEKANIDDVSHTHNG